MFYRLSLFMFLQYAPLGAFLPLLTVHLKHLGFSPWEIGIVWGTHALASLIAPLVAGQVADRWFAPERAVVVCALPGGIALWLLAEIRDPGLFCIVALGYWVLTIAGTTCGSALCFAHLEHPERDFGRVRKWGTIGWISASWLMGAWLKNPEFLHGLLCWVRPDDPKAFLEDSLRLASLLTVLLCLSALTIPQTKPRTESPHRLPIGGVLLLFRDRSFAVFHLCLLGLCICMPFYNQTTQLLLEHIGVDDSWIGPVQSSGQIVEVCSLIVLPWLLRRFGMRATMLIGFAGWAALLLVLTFGSPTWLVVGALSLYGLYITCVLLAGQIFVHRMATDDVRTSVQGVMAFLAGIGLLVGNLLAGGVREYFHGAFAPTFGVAASMAFLLLAGFFVGFREERTAHQPAA